jgi:hypothetical protein
MKKLLGMMLIGLLCLFLSPAAFCEEGTPTETDTITDADSSGSKFQSRDLLVETLTAFTKDASEPGDSQGTGDQGSEGNAGTGEEGTSEQTSGGQVEAFVESLSDEQVFALNRSLNNAVNSGLNVQFEWDALQKVVDENYNKQQINALTKAFEEEAKFLALYESTGNEKFNAKAESQKAKFLAKIDRFAAPEATDPGDAVEETQVTAPGFKSESKKQAKLAAKSEARRIGKKAAKDAAKKEGKHAAKSAAKKAAKDAKKQAKKEKKHHPKKNKKKT